MNDRTTLIEADISRENKAHLGHLWRLFAYVVNSARSVSAIYISLTVLLSLLRPVLAGIWGRYIDLASVHSPGENVLPLIGLVAAYFVIGFVCDLLDRYTTPGREIIEGLDMVQMNRLQELFHTRVYRKIASLVPDSMEVPKINDLISRVFDFSQGGWRGLNRDVMINGYRIIAKTVSVLGIAATLWIFHPLLAAITLIAPVPTLYTTYVGNKLTFKLVKDNSKVRREFGYYETLMLGPAAKEIKSLGLHRFFFGKWKRLADEYSAKEKQTQLRKAILEVVSNTISALALAGGNVLAIYLMAKGQISIGELSSVMLLVSTLISDTSALFSSAATFVSKKNEAAVFFDLMDLREQNATGAPMPGVEVIEAKNLRYRYPLTDRYVLNGVDLTIRSGEKIALVGENGAGKTTFVKLLTGMLQPSDGQLLINGTPVEEIDPASRYAAQSAVFQEPARYNTFTVADNVYLGDTSRERDPEEIEAALQSAGFDGPSSDALLGKDLGGTDLSGGQWQKLAIARGWYRRRPFVILDEPTSNLDPLAETDVFRRYIEISRDRTVIMVTHRISIASLCDRVIVFKDGKVVEDGTHDSLIDLGGEYARLHAEQSQWYQR
ncbi:MAG: ABC transporter ATP-binding protein [Bacillota bacterium]